MAQLNITSTGTSGIATPQSGVVAVFSNLADNGLLYYKYSDGSIATLIYSCMGNDSAEKERLEVHQEGNVYVIKDYKELTTNGRKIKTSQDKGHYQELLELKKALRGEKNNLLTKEEAILTTEITFQIMEKLK